VAVKIYLETYLDSLVGRDHLSVIER